MVSVVSESVIIAVFKSPVFVVGKVVRDTSGQTASRFQGCAGSVFPCLRSSKPLVNFGSLFPLVRFLEIEYLYYDF